MLAVLPFISFTGFSQPTLCTDNKKAIALYIEADNFRVRRQFRQAEELLLDAIQKDKNFCEAYYRLALVYHDMKDGSRAIQTMIKGLEITKDPKKKKVFYYDLADEYLLRGDYETTLKYVNLFLAEEKSNAFKIDQAKFWLQTCEFAIKNQKNISAYKPRMLSDTVNCFVMQYFPVLTGDEQQLFFTRRNGSTQNDTEDLVVSTRDAKGKWTKPVSVSSNINSPENEGTCTVSADGRLLIFTSCQGRAGYGSCDLFMSEKVGEEWSVPVNLGPGVNSGFWESQPSLSADGRVLYFVSERRVGMGGKDIYVSYKNAKGEWSTAANLGPAINSRADDLSPFIHANGRTLFFASKGRVGFGGFDIFVSDRVDNQWSEPRNFGAPVNNHEDQFSLFITADGTKGYYSHEQELNDNTGRIYEITIPEELRIEHRSNYVKGKISDAENGNAVKAQIELMDLKKNELVSVVSSDSLNGKYLMVLTKGSDYGLFVSAPGYLFRSLNFDYEELKQVDPIVVDISLQRARSGASMVLNNIFFDYGKFDIKPESISELEKVSKFLTDNPKIKIEISGHTDNQGTEQSNQVLSEKRAMSVSEYLFSKSVVQARVKAIGYGSKKPIKENDTEQNRQVNRRIEFRIIE
jgi:outer membrane protein OmpA-like peptidoglycan-associated protein/Tol biopolymer transport system component